MTNHFSVNGRPYETEVVVTLLEPLPEIVADIKTALGIPTEYVVIEVLLFGTEINSIFRHADSRGIQILAFEPGTSLRARLPISDAEVAIKADSSSTTITITSRGATSIERFDATMVLRWLKGENVDLQFGSLP